MVLQSAVLSIKVFFLQKAVERYKSLLLVFGLKIEQIVRDFTHFVINLKTFMTNGKWLFRVQKKSKTKLKFKVIYKEK